MIVDAVCIAVIFVFALFGWFSGFWAQVVRLIALVGAYFISKPVGDWLYPPLSPWLGSPWVGRVVATGLAFFVLYALLSAIGWLVLRRLRRNKPHIKTGLDSLMGALLGAAKGAVLVVVILSAMALVEHTGVGKVFDNVNWRDSVAAGKIRERNVLEDVKLPVVGNIKTLKRLGRDKRLRRRAAKDPAVRKLLRHPKVRKLMKDQKLRRAMQRGDMRTLMGDPRVSRLLKERDIQRLIRDIDLSKLKAAQGASKRGKAPPLPSSKKK